MALDDYNTDGLDVNGSTTISELEEMFGESAVRRALSYMDSLSEADKKYRESLEGSNYAENFTEEVAGEEVSDDKTEEMNEKWARESSESGLGMGDE